MKEIILCLCVEFIYGLRISDILKLKVKDVKRTHINIIAKVLLKLQNSISKDKIKNKIEEIKSKLNNTNQKVLAGQIDVSLISCLQELLEENYEVRRN